jgi:hypothetical protein
MFFSFPVEAYKEAVYGEPKNRLVSRTRDEHLAMTVNWGRILNAKAARRNIPMVDGQELAGPANAGLTVFQSA